MNANNGTATIVIKDNWTTKGRGSRSLARAPSVLIGRPARCLLNRYDIASRAPPAADDAKRTHGVGEETAGRREGERRAGRSSELGQLSLYVSRDPDRLFDVLIALARSEKIYFDPSRTEIRNHIQPRLSATADPFY